MERVSWIDDREQYQAIAAKIDPAATLFTKDHWVWTAAWIGLIVITLGLAAIGMPLKKFLERYATTLGPFHGYPSAWPALSKRLLVHECRHTTQFVFAGWFVPVLGWFFGRKVRAVCGLLPMAVVYGLVIFPIGLALGRWLLELDADRTSWRWAIRNGFGAGWVRERAARFGRQVCGGPYLWAWVLGGVGVFERSAEKVICEYASGEIDR
jgi:hypothetical protein